MLQFSIGVSVLHTSTLLAHTLLLVAADMTHYMTCRAGGLPAPTLYKMSACFIQAQREPEHDS